MYFLFLKLNNLDQDADKLKNKIEELAKKVIYLFIFLKIINL